MSSFTGEPRPGGASGGLRQYQADFTGTLVNASKTVRPDAIVLDPLTAYTTGPKALGDQSDGPTAWVWRVRVSGTTVLLARENNTRDGWNAEVTLFTFTGVAPTEVDVSFDQSARAVVCMPRPTGAGGLDEVWLYYYDSVAVDFVFVSFGRGRTPRVVLDNPQTPDNSDVLLVFLDPVADRLRLRQQRDRFGVVYDSPLTDVALMYLEELVITQDNRIRCVLSVRNPTAGTYSIRLLDSTLYPFVLPPEDALRGQAPVLLNTSNLRRALLSAGPLPFGQANVSEDAIVDVDAVQAQHPTIVAGTSSLGTPIIPVSVFPEDALQPQHPVVLPSSALGVPLVLVDVFPEDAVRPQHPVVLNTSLLGTPIIAQDVFPEDAVRPQHPVVLATSTLA